MGREIRRVPPNWEHPLGDRVDFYQPLYDESYPEALAQFREKPSDWGYQEPRPEYYRPEWTPEDATAYQVYENVSEGTPISPVLPDRAALLEWLTTDGSGLGIGGRKMPLTREQAERFIEDEYSPSIIAVGGYFGSPLTEPEQPTTCDGYMP